MSDNAFIAFTGLVGILVGAVFPYIVNITKGKNESDIAVRNSYNSAQEKFRDDLILRIAQVQGQLDTCLTECAQCRADGIESRMREDRLTRRVSALEEELHRRRATDRGEPV